MSNKNMDDMGELISFHERFNILFQDEQSEPASQQAYTWTPAFDIYETEKEFVIKADVAGIKENDVSLTVDNGVLTIKGERRPRQDTESESYHCMERCFGKFMRSFVLPPTVSINNIRARLYDGVLMIDIPKRETEALPVTCL
ncbi:MAG: Hsp20/alpha crystallin family protein [Nitrospirae bacterium]|nr:Hsp20/alpha crystallin family protein [Nitrospirota bacterium]MBF0591696.1 Hsp20/alpha crystallin family protein [Nitrospirota bacterium]